MMITYFPFYNFCDAVALQYLSDLIDLLQKLVYYNFCNFMSYLFNEILNSFRKNGMRITEQRKHLLTIILQNPDLSPKELFYIAHKEDNSIGRATVYRTVHSLQELGYIRRRNITIEQKRQTDKVKSSL